jgi:hypothetical protein
LTWGAVLALAAGLVYAADVVPTDIMMPGTQPKEVGTFESPNRCDNCHGGYDEARVWSNEPAFGWRGGAMGNAGRDPIFWATLAIAEQDFDGAGDLCIRCHSAAGWFAGRSTPTDGSGLMAGDDDGIDCDTCHKATNPDMSEHQGTISLGFEPYDVDVNDPNQVTEGYYGSGILSVWGGNDKLGPYADARAKHQVMPSAFHRGDICGSCHDVSNPAVGDLAPNNGAQVPLELGTFNGTPNVLDPGQDPTTKAAFNNPPYAYGIVERTFSEYKSGLIGQTFVENGGVDDYSTLPIDLKVQGGALAFAYNAAMQAGGTYEDGTLRTFNCQGCHMRPDEGIGCNKAGTPTRFDLPKHDQSGGNHWMWPLIQYQDVEGTLRMGGGLTQTQIDAMDAGRQRAEQQLQMAANLEVDGDTVRITNLTGHKLISGYPEGRRMWLNVRWYCKGDPCGETGAYGPLGVTFQNPRNTAQTFDPESILDLNEPGLRIYDAHYAMTQDWADALASLGWDGNMALSFNRLTGEVDATLQNLASGLLGPYHETFHFALNNYVSKDNRIPPFGFDGTEAAKRNALPVPTAQYGGNGEGTTYDYRDEFQVGDLNPPKGANAADLTLFYQGTSWEYILFLWKANKEQNPFLGAEGINMLDAWLNADPVAPMVPPFVMATATWESTGCTTPSPESCDDGLDNDCDGLVDAADPDCTGCTSSMEPDDNCDGFDDDCNGLIDDGYVTTPTTCGIGACGATGSLECVDGSIVDICLPGTPLPSDATCDGIDDDCNGLIDEDYIAIPTTCGIGLCSSTGTLDCLAGSTVDSCSPGTPGLEGPPGDATCNDNLDNDCDGLTDEADPDCAPLACEALGEVQCTENPLCRWNKRKGCLTR